MSKTTLTKQELSGLRGKRWTPAEARTVLAAQEASGETVAGFARRHGLLAQRLSWWRSRLGEWREESTAAAQMLVPAVVRASGGDGATAAGRTPDRGRGRRRGAPQARPLALGP